MYFTDNAVITAHAPASIAPPSTANGRLSVAYTQLNTTRKENVVAQESTFHTCLFPVHVAYLRDKEETEDKTTDEDYRVLPHLCYLSPVAISAGLLTR